MTFETDLHKGIFIEKEVLLNLKKKYPSAVLVDAFKGYDIWIPELNFGVEVKYDKMSNETGNIVLEYEFNGKDSGLLTTTAAYWVIYDGVFFKWFKPAQIIKCIFDSKKNHSVFVGNGDRASKKAFLISKKFLFDNYSEKL
tara:strand:+ start:752 stop:1174 length:423 start_codon:yes stop_codon:yes gene_type:complete